MTAFFTRLAAAPAVRILRDGIAGSRDFLARRRERWRRFSTKHPRLAVLFWSLVAGALVITNATIGWRKDQRKIPPEVLAHCSRLDQLAGIPDEAQYRQLCHFASTSIPEVVVVFAGIFFPLIAFMIFSLWYLVRFTKAGWPDTEEKRNDTLAFVIPLGIVIFAAMFSSYLSGWTLKLSVFGSGLALFFIIPPLLYWRRLWRLRKQADGSPAP